MRHGQICSVRVNRHSEYVPLACTRTVLLRAGRATAVCARLGTLHVLLASTICTILLQSGLQRRRMCAITIDCAQCWGADVNVRCAF